MRIITASGDPARVSQRGWPQRGLGFPQTYQQGGALTVTGLLESQSYSALYKSNPWVNAAVRSIAWGLSRMPLGVYSFTEDGQRQNIDWRVPGGPGAPSAAYRLSEELNTSAPLDRAGPQRRMRRTMTDYLVFGNAIWVIEPDGLWYVPWKKIRVLTGTDVEILGYEILGSTGNRFLAPEQVIHFNAGDDPDSPIGVSPMESLTYTLQLHEAIQRHLVKFFENSARPSANFKLDKATNKDTIKFVQEQLRDLYSGPENAGKVLVTTGDYQPLTASNDQSQLVELARLSREEIAGVYRIPLPVLGVLDHAIKSNVKELRQQYVRDAIGNWAPAVEDDIVTQRVRPNKALRGYFIEFDMDQHLKPDLEGMAEAFVKLERTMTTNDRRRKIGLPDLPYPEADTVPATPGSSYLGIKAKPSPLAGLPGLPADSTEEESIDSEDLSDGDDLPT